MEEIFDKLDEGLKDLEIDDKFLENLELYFKKLMVLHSKLDNLRDKIRGEKLKKFKDYEITNFRKELKEAYNEQDALIENTEDLSPEEKEKFYKNQSYIKVLSVKLDNQILIGRIVNKIQREEAARINGEKENLKNEFESIKINTEKTYEEIKEENKSSKENILTISSLIFTAFTLIQLNFVAFQNSNTYNVLDRVILFSGINIFIILGIYTVFSMIKALIDKKEETLFENLKSGSKKTEIIVVVVILGILSVIFGISLWIKNSKEKTVEITNIEELKKDVDKFNNEIFNLNKENLELKEKIKELNFIIERERNNLKLDFEQKNIKTKEEILNLEKEIIKLKK